MTERVLFVPASAPSGSGEYYRCLAIARELSARRPGLRAYFVLCRSAGVERDPAYGYHPLPSSPTHHVDRVRALIRRLQPALVVFDSAGRRAQLQQARRAGSRVVWISDRPGPRRRAFRPSMLARLDLHLTAAPEATEPRLHWWERAALRCLGGPPVRFFDSIAPRPDPRRRARVLDALGLPARGYLAVAAGGGGYRHGGRPVPELLLEAAERTAAATGVHCAVLMGPQYDGKRDRGRGVTVVRQLPTEAVGQVLDGARAAVIGAGSQMVAQTLASGVPAVLVPAGGSDQPARIRRMCARGLARAAPLEPAAIAAEAIGLLQRADEREALREALRRAGPSNDLPQVVERLGRLLDP